MRAIHIITTNQADIEKSERMNIPAQRETAEVPFLFDPIGLQSAWIEDDEIRIQYPEGSYSLKNTPELWNKLEKHFNRNEDE